MERLNYIGCKHTLINNIISLVKDIPDHENCSFADLFAGTGTVGFNMRDHCKFVISNDMEYYSFVLNTALLECNYSEKLEKIINKCNDLDSVDGIVYNNFSPTENCERMFFTNENAKKCDAIRQYIENQQLSKNEYYFLIASLIVQMDKVANTASVYGAYLKKFKKSSCKKLFLKPIHKEKNLKQNEVYNEDISNLILDKTFDIVYLDPPYNGRQYSGNYSPLNYICRYSEDIKLKGKTGLIVDYNKSLFCSKVKVKNTFAVLINSLNCKYIILSYNSEGYLKYPDIKDVLCSKGGVTLHKIKYKKFKSNKTKSNEFVFEYLWVVDTNSNKEFETKTINLVV